MEINERGVNISPEKNKSELIKSNLGGLEVSRYSDAKERGVRIKEGVLDKWAKHSGYARETLEALMRTRLWAHNPLAPYYHERYVEATTGDVEMVDFYATDFNNCASRGRAGEDPQHTFVTKLEKSIKKIINRTGSFFIVSALTGEQMVWHMAKEQARAIKEGEKGIPENTIICAENGRAWLIPRTENGKTFYTEYRLPLSENEQTALDNVKGKIGEVAGVLRGEGMAAFVNEQKFSKCTMEASKNGRTWYRQMIEKTALPYLKKNGATWEGNPEKFIMDGVEFAISPTDETIEIEITGGSDKIGKVSARRDLENTVTDILNARKVRARLREVTSGDSVKFAGSDAGLTEPNAPTIPFVVPGSERPVTESMNAITDAQEVKRKYWPTYIEDEKGVRLAGPGVALADFYDSILETMPHLKISTEEFSRFLVDRLINIQKFKKYKEYSLEDENILLYKYPDDLTSGQRATFLQTGGSDLPVSLTDSEKVSELIDTVNSKLS